jgi:hypothetical protein
VEKLRSRLAKCDQDIKAAAVDIYGSKRPVKTIAPGGLRQTPSSLIYVNPYVVFVTLRSAQAAATIAHAYERGGRLEAFLRCGKNEALVPVASRLIDDNNTARSTGTSKDSYAQPAPLSIVEKVPVDLRFRGKRMQVHRAPSPETIIWENLGTTNCKRAVRQSITCLFSMLLVAICFGLLFAANLANKTVKESTLAESLNSTTIQCAKTDGFWQISGAQFASIPALNGFIIANSRANDADAVEYLQSLLVPSYMATAARFLFPTPEHVLSCFAETNIQEDFATAVNVTSESLGVFIPLASFFPDTCSPVQRTVLANILTQTMASILRTELIMVATSSSMLECFCDKMIQENPAVLINPIPALSAKAWNMYKRLEATDGFQSTVDIPGIRSGVTVLQPSPSYPFAVCASYVDDFVLFSTLLALVAGVQVLVNVLMTFVLNKSTDFEKHASTVSRSKSLLVRVGIAQVINTGILILCVSAFIPAIPTSGSLPTAKYGDFDRRWYRSQGPSIVVSMMVQALLPHVLSVLQFCAFRFTRCCRPYGGANSQAELHHYYDSIPHFDTVARFSWLLSILFVCFLYSTGCPLLIPIAFLACFIAYFGDLISLVFCTRKGPKESEELGTFVLKVLSFAFVGHFLLGAWMLSAAHIYDVAGSLPQLGAYGVLPFDFSFVDALGLPRMSSVIDLTIGTTKDYAAAIVGRLTLPYSVPLTLFGLAWAAFIAVWLLGHVVVRPLAYTVSTLIIQPVMMCISLLCCCGRSRKGVHGFLKRNLQALKWVPAEKLSNDTDIPDERLGTLRYILERIFCRCFCDLTPEVDVDENKDGMRVRKRRGFDVRWGLVQLPSFADAVRWGLIFAGRRPGASAPESGVRPAPGSGSEQGYNAASDPAVAMVLEGTPSFAEFAASKAYPTAN